MATWSHTFPINFYRTVGPGQLAWGDIQYFTPPSNINITAARIYFQQNSFSSNAWVNVYMQQVIAGGFGVGGSGASLNLDNIKSGATTRFGLAVGISGGTSGTVNISSIRIEIDYGDSGGGSSEFGTIALSKNRLMAGDALTITLAACTAPHRELYVQRKVGSEWKKIRRIGSIYNNNKHTIAYTVPVADYDNYGNNADSFQVRYYVTSYYAGGSPSQGYSKLLTIDRPVTEPPTLTGLLASVVQPEGWPEDITDYAQGFSRVSLEIVGAAAAEGLSLAGYEIKGEGVDHKTASGTFGPFAQAKTMVFTARVKDNRNNWSEEQSVEIQVKGYALPRLINAEAKRTDDQSAPADEGTWATLSAVAAINNNLGNNPTTLQGRVWARTIPPTEPTEGMWFDLSGDLGEPTLAPAMISIEKAYNVDIRLKDRIGGEARSFVIPSAVVGEHILEEAKGAAFGMYALPNRFSIPAHWGYYVGDKKIGVPVVDQVIMLHSSANPADIWPGTVWARIDSGLFPIAAGEDNIGDTGGSDTHDHVLSSNGWADIMLAGSGLVYHRIVNKSGIFRANWVVDYTGNQSGSKASTANQSEAQSLGGKTDSSSTLPPWIAFAMWRRTA